MTGPEGPGLCEAMPWPREGCSREPAAHRRERAESIEGPGRRIFYCASNSRGRGGAGGRGLVALELVVQKRDGLAGSFVLGDLLADLPVGVQYRAVVAAAEGFADFHQRGFG